MRNRKGHGANSAPRQGGRVVFSQCPEDVALPRQWGRGALLWALGRSPSRVCVLVNGCRPSPVQVVGCRALQIGIASPGNSVTRGTDS